MILFRPPVGDMISSCSLGERDARLPGPIEAVDMTAHIMRERRFYIPEGFTTNTSLADKLAILLRTRVMIFVHGTFIPDQGCGSPGVC